MRVFKSNRLRRSHISLETGNQKFSNSRGSEYHQDELIQMNMTPDIELIINKAYQAFNERRIDEVLQLMDSQVHWPNGWEGGYVQGHEEVKAYWTRQW